MGFKLKISLTENQWLWLRDFLIQGEEYTLLWSFHTQFMKLLFDKNLKNHFTEDLHINYKFD